MIAVIFEVIPNPECQQVYLDIAARLKSKLHAVEGFISVERFQSLANQNKLLSLSFWENEEAVVRWKSDFEHQAAQQKGKHTLFTSYRISVAHVMRDYSNHSKMLGEAYDDA
ncbi:antibiotic biosynthesis monooxygenase family protein [Pseudoalteromonas sp. S16_S37]|uniref:antibiotic biosynthesis monooxygenase family protein n=1 Tax=Pseudoalteromonas sp. S16_S37 TaxID=2720228 RepID=UPI001681B1D2|nr:antibiotic biosynthesis monooxygenase [Pseudoalteromonas sp. S16_S37]MBD1582622.1 antibiotic biosynthesis monooxygenase [Pseudoalteromonas sp. S16_S37]